MLVVIASRVIEATVDILSSGKIISNLNIDWARENSFRNMLIPIFNRIKKARRQAKSFVIDVTQAQLTEEVIAEQIEKVYKMARTL